MQELIRILGRIKDRFFPKNYSSDYHEDRSLSASSFSSFTQQDITTSRAGQIKLLVGITVLICVPLAFYVYSLRTNMANPVDESIGANYQGFQKGDEENEYQSRAVAELQQWVSDVELQLSRVDGDSEALKKKLKALRIQADKMVVPNAMGLQARSILGPSEYARARGDYQIDKDLNKPSKSKVKEDKDAQKSRVDRWKRKVLGDVGLETEEKKAVETVPNTNPSERQWVSEQSWKEVGSKQQNALQEGSAGNSYPPAAGLPPVRSRRTARSDTPANPYAPRVYQAKKLEPIVISHY